MPNSKPFPSTEGDLNTYFKTSVDYLIANAVRLLISATNLADLPLLWDAWNTAYPLTQNPDTKTTTATANKNTARDNLKKLLRSIYADIPESVFTEKDRNTLGIPARSTTRTDAPVPTTKPIAKIDTNNRLEHTINFIDEDGSLAKPEGVRGCQIWIKIGAPAIDPSELAYIATDTQTPYLYKFDGKDAGKAAYYWLRWENTRGETGPWSDAVMATIIA